MIHGSTIPHLIILSRGSSSGDYGGGGDLILGLLWLVFLLGSIGGLLYFWS